MVSLFIFSYFAIKTGGVTPLVPLAPAPMIMQVIFICSIEHVFYIAKAIIEKSVFSSVPPHCLLYFGWNENEIKMNINNDFFNNSQEKKNQIKIEDDKASAISQPFRTIPLWARICASWCNCVPCFLPSFSIILRLKSGSN